MIAGDVKVIKFCIHRNEVGTNKCDWLPIIYQTTEVGSCYFALDTERGDFFLAWEQESWRRKEREKKKKKRSLFVFLRHTQAVMCMCVWRRSAKKQPVGWRGAGGSGCDSFKESEHVNQK